MPTILTVTVFGGNTPEPTHIFLYRGANRVLMQQRQQNFTLPLDNLQPGAVYSLFISGRNPLAQDGATQCELTQDDIFLHPPDNSPVLKKGLMYLAEFHFTIKINH
jgi:hypothetical protein